MAEKGRETRLPHDRSVLLAIPDRTRGIPLGDGGTLVIQFLPTGDRDLDLRAPPPEIETQRHDRQALRLRLHAERHDFVAVEEELAGAIRIVRCVARLLV